MHKTRIRSWKFDGKTSKSKAGPVFADGAVCKEGVILD
jgi:hypothetical protein